MPGLAPTFAPTRSGKYVATKPLSELLKNPRSIAYLTSLDVTSRLTGGENLTPDLILTVTVLPSADTSGAAVARSGTMCSPSSGLYE